MPRLPRALPPVMVDADALARILDAIDLRVGVARRFDPTYGAPLRLPEGALRLLYVVSGSTHIDRLPSECHVGLDGSAAGITLDRSAQSPVLAAGDVLVTLGRLPITVDAPAAEVVVVDLELAPSAQHVLLALPEVITVRGFDAMQPSAAALAASMGTGPEPDDTRSVVCRMMAQTVLLSVIDAWATAGCAPAGWPTVARDPFLDRVLDAIHAEPGREWTVGSLASVGAMSRSAFAARFRDATGHSPADYVTGVRIDAAKRMLDAGHSVTMTSRDLGYASDEGFSRAFRRRTGMTPSAWRMARRAPVAIPA